jgi:hypothetical protein
MLTQKELKERLYYNPETGIFTWIKTKNNRIKNNTIAGNINKTTKYLTIRINHTLYLAHRLAWLYVYGNWPNNQIDHIDGNRLNNRICNIRNVTSRQNCQNYTRHRNGHLVGTAYHKINKIWAAAIWIDKKNIHLGSFDTAIEAHEAYMQKLQEIENGK